MQKAREDANTQQADLKQVYERSQNEVMGIMGQLTGLTEMFIQAQRTTNENMKTITEQNASNMQTLTTNMSEMVTQAVTHAMANAAKLKEARKVKTKKIRKPKKFVASGKENAKLDHLPNNFSEEEWNPSEESSDDDLA